MDTKIDYQPTIQEDKVVDIKYNISSSDDGNVINMSGGGGGGDVGNSCCISEDNHQKGIIRNSSSGTINNILGTDDNNNNNNNNNSNNKNSNNNDTTNSTITNSTSTNLPIKTYIESPKSISSDSSSVSSSLYEPIVKEINEFINPPSITSSQTIINNQEEKDIENKTIVNNNNNNNSLNDSISSSSSSNSSSNSNNEESNTITKISPTIRAVTRSSPFYNSKAPDIRSEVNGFPLKLNHMKTKEYIWLQLIQNYTHDNIINNEILKSIRIGLPKRIRGYIWRFFSGAIELERKNIGVYQHFLGKHSEEYEYKISKDISRTFPNNPYFNNEQGQNSLFRILKAYSIMDPEIGYTQGMSFIAAVLLSEMDETESFWTFTSIMKNYKLSTLFCHDLSLLRQYLYVIDRLIETLLPKLFSHFKEIGVTPVLFASEWISTLFTYNFDLPISKRLLDVFFIEGRFYLHRMSLAILKIYEKQLIEFEFEDAVEFLKKLGTQIDPDLLLKTSDSLPLTM
ncbi:RabGAP/TBC domain-containing protein [Dictyostelium discoideum AX4]|uniref:RabGAP/TBC domain-containing protein n=1 Tax=Dictyostelium discoideum TaxID=44689 RepID=Q550W0_DICDI|nr:RabGAP/TBC domain-containing protein [Dictyostelium discoideum AX4]EAL68982.1 RabGAP/TBC domain-containing protein [Dictyostelium discoideum AX4]|eukprot:XP_642822.1 RabGAP/TBC domain-containing protein [Dictyostelium discoideum AX4]